MSVMAQKPVIEFSKKSHDFGKINEADGKVTTVFEFKNTGMEPLVISKVRASCGCTSPNWTKTPIAPGQTGTVSATYNPAGRPGKFTKTITVSSNASEPETRLTIKGEVIPKPVDKSSLYPVKMGDLGLKSNSVTFNNINKGENSQRSIEFANLGKEDIHITIYKTQGFLEVSVLPEVIKANETGKIHVVFKTADCKQWGPINENIYVVINGNKVLADAYKINVRANIVEDFSKMTLDEKREAPIMELSTKTIDLGALKANSKKSYKISISNKGQKSLEIRRIVNNNPDVAVAASKSSIGSGKKADIKIDITTKEKQAGPYRRSFSIQTNDPENAHSIINIVWTVE